MGIELLVYCYIAICIAMILYNIAYMLFHRRRDRRQQRRGEKLLSVILEQMADMTQGGAPEEDHLKWLRRKLERVEWLIAFDDAVIQAEQEYPQQTQDYLWACRPVFISLCLFYRKKEPMQQAYLAFLLAKYQMGRDMEIGPLFDTMGAMLAQPSLYCRENALAALYSFGDPQAIVEGLRILDRNPVFHHAKLLTDGLLTFSGDHDVLISMLWDLLPMLHQEVQTAILNYIRFRTAGYEGRMLQLLQEENWRPELHYCAIRYLAKYPYPPARQVLIELLASREESRWNYAAISATALASYPGEDTVEALKAALHSSNWYVRYNAAQSLDVLHVTYLDLSDVMGGNDRYAREILQYRMDERKRRNLEKEEPKEVCPAL